MLSRLGDLLFYTIAEGQERIPIHKFTTVSSPPPAQNPNPLGSLKSGEREGRKSAGQLTMGCFLRMNSRCLG